MGPDYQAPVREKAAEQRASEKSLEWFRWLVASCLTGLAAFTVIQGLRYCTEGSRTLWLYLAGMALFVSLRLIRRKISYKVRPWTALAGLLILCIAWKLSFVIHFRILPSSDFFTFWATAAQFSEGKLSPDSYLPHYLALFPHIFGYSSFLSVMFRLCGTKSPLIAVLLNVALSVVSMACIWDIVRRLSSDSSAAAAALLWIFFPSQTIYNLYVLSEPYYTTLLLLTLDLAVHMSRQTRILRWILWAVISGLLLTLTEAARPVGGIFLLAIALYALLLSGKLSRQELLRRISVLLLASILFFGGKAVTHMLFTACVGEKPATSMGYTLYVGLNAETDGAWSQDDSDELSRQASLSQPFSAETVQEAMKGEALQRLKALGISGVVRLLPDKLRRLLTNDGMCVVYANGVLPHGDFLKSLCCAYWYVLWSFAALGAIRMARRHSRSPLWVGALFVVGLTAAHMLTETAPRYHYCMGAMLVLLAVEEKRKRESNAVAFARQGGVPNALKVSFFFDALKRNTRKRKER